MKTAFARFNMLIFVSITYGFRKDLFIAVIAKQSYRDFSVNVDL